MASSVPHECFYRCNWPEHSSNLTAALTKASLTDEKVAAYLKWCCVRYTQALDSDGRTLVHVAASKGRLKLLSFLLNHQDVNVNAKDRESLYTALHRSLFYGQLHCAVRLIQWGAGLQQTDADDLTPLDHVMKDRPKILEYNLHHLCEVYVWGTNTNYTLGIGHNHSRANPEPLPSFRKSNASIKQVEMDKFHSVFVGSNGQVWSCGHGLGGRLGLGDESTALVPKALKFGGGNNKSDACSAVSIGTDHTVLLVENGSVWTCGLNKYHQLGHNDNPPPEKVLFPRQVKGLKGADVVGVSASRFHTCFWTKNQLFTCGLHGGQLGHLKGDATVPVPKLVTAVPLKDSSIEHVATSEGATVLVNNKGDVFLLHEYQCRKLTPRNKPLKAKKVCAIGGHLDHKTCSSDLKEKGGDELKILLLEADTNKLYLWLENGSQQFTRCIFSLKRQIRLTDVYLNRFSVLIATVDGEAFQGEIRAKKKKAVPTIEPSKVASPKSAFHEFVDKDECEHVKLKRIPHVHRAVRVTSDLRGRNFAAIQVHPKSGLLQVPYVESTEMSQNMTTLLETADLYDSVHDVVFEVGSAKYPAHRYVMAYASKVFEEMLEEATSVDGVSVVKINDVRPETFRRVLRFVYSNDCDLLRTDTSSFSFERVDSIGDEFEEAVDEEAVSAYEHVARKAVARKKKSPKPTADDPVKSLREAAKKFRLTTLHKKLQLVKYENGSVLYTSQRRFVPDDVKFDRKSLQNLWDVTLKSSDNVEIKAHKCILTARLEYFNCLINQGWLESSQKSPLKIPIPARALEILIRHLYTDEAPELAEGDDGDLASLVLVFADQYLCARLKEYAETCLANLLTLRNAVEMLQMAETYNAPQLKRCTMEFICLNLPALLESRSLEVLDDAVLSELRDFYRSWLPCMSRRYISTHAAAPDDDLVDLVHAGEPVALDSVSEETLPTQKTPKVPKKKPKDKKNSDSGRTRNVSVGSLTSDEESAAFAESPGPGAKTDEEGWVKVTNHPSKQQRIVQTRLKVAVEAAEILSTPVQFTKLVSDRTLPPTTEKKSEKEMLNLLSASEKDFPSLNASPSERTSVTTATATPKASSTETIKKFSRLSQRQRKRLATLSLSEDEESPKSPDAIKSVWGIPKNDFFTLSETEGVDVEIRRNEIDVASSPPLIESARSKDPSLSAIMAAEKHQRNLINKLKSKPLQYTQMEDKAMEDLLLLYDVKNVTDEKITVRRAETVFISPPVWVSSHR